MTRPSPFRLLDVEPTVRRVGTTKALVPVDRETCPLCGSDVGTVTTHEDALFFHGGYGATRRSRGIYCKGRECRWGMTTEVTEVRPPRRTAS